MLQRIQSVWLLLAAMFDAVTFRFPFYSGDWSKDTLPAVIDLNARTTVPLTVLTVLDGLLAFATIFLYHNRKLQLRLSYFGIFLTLVLLTMYFFDIEDFYSGTVAIWAVFYFAILVCYILAARGIWRDQKLIKSLNRFR